jgi:MFS family permease
LISYAASYQALSWPVIGEGMRDWQLVFLAIGAVGVPIAFLVFAFPDPGRRSSALPGAAATAARAGRQHFKKHWRFYACHFSAFSLFCFLSAATTAWSATYMMREFNWTPASAGALLGIKTLVGGAVGIIGSGFLADRMVKRGRQDAHFRMYLYILPVHAVVGAITFTAGHMWIAFIGLGLLAIVAPFIAVAAAGLQLGTIPERRGIASASFLLIYNLVGFGLGPAFIAMISRAMSGDGADLGPALALSYVVVPPIIMVFLALGLRPMRTAVADVGGMSSKQSST